MISGYVYLGFVFNCYSFWTLPGDCLSIDSIDSIVILVLGSVLIHSGYVLDNFTRNYPGGEVNILIKREMGRKEGLRRVEETKEGGRREGVGRREEEGKEDGGGKKGEGRRKER